MNSFGWGTEIQEPPPPPLPLPETLHTANEITLGVLDYSQANRTMCELASKLQMSSAAAHRLHSRTSGDAAIFGHYHYYDSETEKFQQITAAVKIS
jgi:hypothetical protein